MHRDSFREGDLELMGVRNPEVDASSSQVVVRMTVEDYERLIAYSRKEKIPDWVGDVLGYVEDAEYECESCEHCITSSALDDAARIIRRHW